MWFALFLLAFLPVQWSISIGDGFEVPLFRLGAILLLFWFGAVILVSHRSVKFPLPILLPLVGFLGITLIGALWLGIPAEHWFRKYLFLAGLLPLSLVWQALLSRSRGLSLVQASLLGALASAILGMGIFVSQFLFGVGEVMAWLTQSLLPWFLGERLGNLVASFPSLLVNIGGETWLRLTAFFPDPHVAAFFFGMSSFLSFGLWLETSKKFWAWTGGFLLLSTLLTFSRGGYFGLLAGGVVFIGLLIKGRGRSFRVILTIGLLPILLWFSSPAIERFISSFTLEDASSVERLSLWQTAGITWQAHPWFGVGLGQYAEHIHPFVGDRLPYYAHNLFLDLGVEVGIVGLTFFLALIFLAWMSALHKAWQRPGLALGVLAALTFYLIYSLFETALFSLHVTALLTLVIALAYRDKDYAEPKTPHEE